MQEAGLFHKVMVGIYLESDSIAISHETIEHGCWLRTDPKFPPPPVLLSCNLVLKQDKG